MAADAVRLAIAPCGIAPRQRGLGEKYLHDEVDVRTSCRAEPRCDLVGDHLDVAPRGCLEPVHRHRRTLLLVWSVDVIDADDRRETRKDLRSASGARLTDPDFGR